MPLERNLLAEFFSRLATQAFEREQWDIAADYIRLVNEVHYDNRTTHIPGEWGYRLAGPSN